MKDTFKHQGMRNRLVLKLQDKGIVNHKVLQAISKVPRHFFLDSSFEDHAYQDKAFPIGADQTISHPYTVAFQTSLLDIQPNQKILEIGTGCGYQTAILHVMGAKVYTIERQYTLYQNAKSLLSKMNYIPKYIGFSDGYKGLDVYAPYDGIIVTAGAPYIPKPLLLQLSKQNGKLVIPVGDKDQIMTRITRTAEDKFAKETFGNFKFVPLLQDKV